MEVSAGQGDPMPRIDQPGNVQVRRVAEALMSDFQGKVYRMSHFGFRGSGFSIQSPGSF